MLKRLQGLRIDEIIGKLCVAHLVAPHLHGIVDHFFFGARAIFLQNFARVGIGKDRLNPRRHIAGVKADRAGRRDAGQQRVANAMLCNCIAHISVHLLHRATGQIALSVKQRKRPLFFCQINRGQIGRTGNLMHPGLSLRRRFYGSITQPNHEQSIGQPGHPKANPALGLSLALLRLQWETAGIHHIIHHPNRGCDQIGQDRLIQLGLSTKRIRDQTRHIDRSQQTGSIGRQGLLTARIGGRDGFAIIEVIGLIDPIDKDHTWFGKFKGGIHDLIPKLHRPQTVIDLPLKNQIPRLIGLDRRHKGIRDQNRDIKHPQTRRIAFCGNEIQNIRVITAHSRHHRAAPAACRHNRAAHSIPNIHKGEGARGIRSNALHLCPFGTNGREIISDAAALLHGQRGLFQHVKNPAHTVGNCAHDKAIEQSHTPLCASPSGDASGRQKFEIGQSIIELRLPFGGCGLDRGQRARDALPAVFDGLIDGRTIRLFEAVFHIPDLFGDWSCKACHEPFHI